jgi:hypothetical protein
MLSVKMMNGELIQNVPWLSLPKDPIQRIKYVFNGKTVILEGYEAYNHLTERVYAVIGRTVNVRATYLMGLYGGNVTVVTLNRVTGEINKYETKFGEEYNGRPSTGWQSGLVGIPATQIL